MGNVTLRVSDLSRYVDLTQFLDPTTESRWAVLLCKFADDSSSTLPLTTYRRLFTGEGTGSMNMVDYFLDMSHGKVDVSRSDVFGWYTLGRNRSDYAGNVATPPEGKFNRNGLVELCKAAATGAPADMRADLSKYDGVVVSMNGATDLFGYVGGMAAFCDSLSLQPALLGQEMGHGYGLDHSRVDGSEDDYMDPWDVMSNMGPYQAPHDEWTSIGPGLNACNMRHVGWLDEARVWKASGAFDTTIELRPLHRRDLDGFLAAELGGYLVEYRSRERWDASIPWPAVFVHRLSDGRSYLMAGDGGAYALTTGATFTRGNPELVFDTHDRVEVAAINEDERTAVLRLIHKPAAPIPGPVGPGILWGAVAEGGGGWIIVNGKPTPVPPHGPAMRVLEQLEAYLAAERIQDGAAQRVARQAILSTIGLEALTQLARLQPTRSPRQARRTSDW
jgi:hypothetical protein